MSERRYPRWLNFASGFALFTAAAGVPMFLFNQRAAVCMEAVGWLAVWATGTLAQRFALRTQAQSIADEGEGK